MSWGVSDLSVRYGSRTALDAVSVDILPGSVTVVVGGDGAGKTTLLRALVGIVPHSGSVRRPPRQDIGYISGAVGVYADLTVDENIAFAGGAYGLTGDERERRAARLLEQTGIAAARGRLAGRLSGGMRQKLAFALAMLHQPKLLVLDEPTTGVDPVSRSELWRLIAGAAADGAAVLVTTTYLDEAERAARVLVLDGGRAVAAGPPEAAAAALPRPLATAARDAAKGPREDAATTGSSAAAVADASRGAAAGAPLAEMRAVVRRFGDLVAVDGAHLDVGAGEVVGLLGANGAGKTTLIRMLLGLLRPSAGEALLFGAPPSRAARRRIGYVPQGLGLWEDLTVAENLSFTAAAFGTSPPPLDAELAEAEDGLVRDLPLGLRRRLAFASALAHAPELLVLDEPTSGVDPRARARLWDTVHEAAAQGAGVLVTTHYLEETSQCDRLVIMAAGRVVAEGPEAAIVGDRRAVEVELGSDAPDTAREASDTAGEASAAAAAQTQAGDGPVRTAGETSDWATAFGVLADAGLPVALHGRTLRVAGGDVERVRTALEARHVAAGLRLVPATLEETFVELALAAAEAAPRAPGETPRPATVEAAPRAGGKAAPGPADRPRKDPH